MQLFRKLALSIAIPACALGAQLGVCAAASADTPTQIVRGARVEAVADRVAHDLVTGPDRSVAAAYQVADQQLPAGDVRIEAAGAPFVSASYVGVPVAISVGGKLARTVVAGFRVTSYVRTAVAAHDLAPGTVLAAEDLAVARVPCNGRPAVEIGVLVGRRLNVAAASGATLYVEQTMPNAVVKAGQAAILVIHDGIVALMADVVARTGGAIGDTVTVVNPQTQKAIAAVVTAPNRVDLTLPGGER
jgi:flagella basal body P-ring formation protein FlgA